MEIRGGRRRSRVDRLLTGGEKIDLGNLQLQMVHTPGHTPGHLSFFIPGLKFVYTSDIDLTDFGPWYGNISSIIEDFLHSIEIVRRLQPALLVTSHGPVYREAIEERLDNYIAKICQREEAILGYLSEEKSLEELVDKKIIIWKHPEPQFMYRYFERTMLEKHLSRLMARGKVRKNNDLRYRACEYRKGGYFMLGKLELNKLELYQLLKDGIEPLSVDTPFREALLALQSCPQEGLAVVDCEQVVVGILAKKQLPDLYLKNIPVDTPVGKIMCPEYNALLYTDTIDDALQIHGDLVVLEDWNGKYYGTVSRNYISRFIYSQAMRRIKEFDAAFSSAHNGILVINKEGVITGFNVAAERISKLKREKIIGKKLSEVNLPKGLLEVVQTGKSHIMERFVYNDVVFVTNRHPIIEDGEVTGAIGIFYDISELESISEELETVKEINAQLHTLIESSYDGILITDNQGQILQANCAYQRLSGIEGGLLSEQNVNDLVGTSINLQTLTHLTCSRRRAVTIVEENPSGNQLLVTGNPVFNDKGEVIRVVINVRDLTELNRLRRELEQTRELKERYESELAELRNAGNAGIVAKSKAMLTVLELAQRVALVDSTVLIQGESGVGKEVIAKYVHHNSNRQGGPFIRVNCCAIPENLLESELFGYEGGAFTGAKKEGKPGLFELAHSGTIFLDEIGDLPLTLQVKLLRVLQEREVTRVGGTKPRSVDVRILVATHRNLLQMVREGKFREDLFYRLNVVPITIPPLRERVEDIEPLTDVFLDKFNRRYNMDKTLHPEVISIFKTYPWPGNVRELENIVERLIVMVPGLEITVDYLPHHLMEEKREGLNVLVDGIMPLREAVTKLESQLIEMAMKKYASSHQVAKVLEVDPSTLFRKIRKCKKLG